MQQPRVRDKRSVQQREEFSSKILPKYLRKTRSMEELIPWLYLKGISTNDFPEALQSLLGPECYKSEHWNQSDSNSPISDAQFGIMPTNLHSISR